MPEVIAEINTDTQQGKYQDELFKRLRKATNDYFCEMGGYYYQAIINLEKDIRKAIIKNV